ncbi:hypothetical protein GDI1653 [Gluconacetobacter diazotrophicus PA1 5]|uniref:Uncharacterized protein n=1 Tax=Gluconacetobacter diazotrophicus (strain ATCC 49037 / DSM 5601 / CCUG 37298 / CIP 103539 / LMG 7603 / PAl5) TaxID=272568 RepID=A9HH57_GLUDA|nr:hypothetical protein GDI1653 [Gluconacetobacter diazotrophicus PA1 5]
MPRLVAARVGVRRPRAPVPKGGITPVLGHHRLEILLDRCRLAPFSGRRRPPRRPVGGFRAHIDAAATDRIGIKIDRPHRGGAVCQLTRRKRVHHGIARRRVRRMSDETSLRQRHSLVQVWPRRCRTSGSASTEQHARNQRAKGTRPHRGLTAGTTAFAHLAILRPNHDRARNPITRVRHRNRPLRRRSGTTAES